jgi:hypothetical protein
MTTDPFIRYLKEEFRTIWLQLWGLFGTGKSSFINLMATLYNEDVRFPNRKLTPTFSRPSGVSVTTELKQYNFNNVSLCNSWGWEEACKDLYSDLLFQLMLGGQLGREFAMDNAKAINMLKLPNVESTGAKLDAYTSPTSRDLPFPPPRGHSPALAGCWTHRHDRQVVTPTSLPANGPKPTWRWPLAAPAEEKPTDTHAVPHQEGGWIYRYTAFFSASTHQAATLRTVCQVMSGGKRHPFPLTCNMAHLLL